VFDVRFPFSAEFVVLSFRYFRHSVISSMSSIAISIAHVSFRYGQRLALDDVSLEIQPGEIFALLGPNGGGKTTLFRLVSTLIPPQEGEIRILGHCVRRETDEVRRVLGVVFQAPSVDKKLTVAENVRHQGWLYGLRGAQLAARQQEMLEQVGLADRASDRVETLSGGLRRRVELAKGMLHRPLVLLMDEPSTGLDPAARNDLWTYLRQLRETQGVTTALTTHLLEEAEKADRLAILDRGCLVALDTPSNLRASLGGDCITIQTDQPDMLATAIRERFGLTAQAIEGSLRVQQADGQRLIGPLVEAFPEQIRSITLGKPTLEDVFIARTGHRFWQGDEESGDRASVAASARRASVRSQETGGSGREAERPR
jgi:ABC-2 type transport system ATP-binding protein